MSDSLKLWWNFCHSDHNWIQSFFMDNFYVHFQIVQIFCHIDHDWISFFMNSCNMLLQSNILYEIFVPSSQLYFSNPLWTFSIMHFKFFFDNFFLQILHLNCVIFENADHFHDVISRFISDFFYFMNILSMYFQLESFGKIFTTLIVIEFFHLFMNILFM